LHEDHLQSDSGVLRSAIRVFGAVASTSPLALAAPPANVPARPTVAAQRPAYSSSMSDGRHGCRYKPLPGSRIKVHVCALQDGAEYRMDRRVRTIAAVIPDSGGAPIAARRCPRSSTHGCRFPKAPAFRAQCGAVPDCVAARASRYLPRGFANLPLTIVPMC